jgi:hypothetical protein
MTDHPTSSDDKQSLWSDRIAAWKDSGLSQQKYCDQEHLTYTTFVYWRGRLRQLADDACASGKVHFAPVMIRQESDAKLTLQINGLHGVDIRPGFDPALLCQVIRAVQQIT